MTSRENLKYIVIESYIQDKTGFFLNLLLAGRLRVRTYQTKSINQRRTWALVWKYRSELMSNHIYDYEDGEDENDVDLGGGLFDWNDI